MRLLRYQVLCRICGMIIDSDVHFWKQNESRKSLEEVRTGKILERLQAVVLDDGEVGVVPLHEICRDNNGGVTKHVKK